MTLWIEWLFLSFLACIEQVLRQLDADANAIVQDLIVARAELEVLTLIVIYFPVCVFAKNINP